MGDSAKSPNRPFAERVYSIANGFTVEGRIQVESVIDFGILQNQSEWSISVRWRRSGPTKQRRETTLSRCGGLADRPGRVELQVIPLSLLPFHLININPCMLNEDSTEVEWVRQTDQLLVIEDRCSARVAATVPKEPEQYPWFDVKLFGVANAICLPCQWYPWRSPAGESVQLQQQLAHHRYQGHVARFPALPQVLVETA